MKGQPSPLLACTLSSPELTHRRLTVIRELRVASLEALELPNGFAIRFPVGEEWRRKLEEFMAFERQCCAFLSIEIEETSTDEGLWLHITGPDGAKEFVKTELMLVE